MELARIVGRNRKTEPEVANDRVGSTDYFAALDGPDLLSDAEPAAPVLPAVPPVNTSPPPVAQRSGVQQTPIAPHEPAGPIAGTPDPGTPGHVSQPEPLAAQPVAPAPAGGVGAFSDPAGASSIGSAPAPEEPAPTPVPTAFPTDASPAAPHAGAQPTPFPGPVQPPAPSPAAPGEGLEQNLTADLEDELLGAFHETFEPRSQQARPVTPAFGVAPEPLGPPPVISEPAVPGQPLPAEPDVSKRAGPDPLELEQGLAAAMAEPAPVQEPARHVPADAFPQEDIFAEVAPAPTAQEPAALAIEPSPEPQPATPVDDVFEQVFAAQIQPGADPVPDTELRPAQDLDAQYQEPAEAQQPLPGIDEMVWPAAADALASAQMEPEQEDLPPPEGYDLDAVARAMQESDPTLGDAGVLPPHPVEEQELAPQSGGSRKGIYAALAVLGVGVLGAGAFAFVDFGPSSAPSGPPAVIAGLDGPLKVYPENTPQESTGSSKLIYDRVGSNDPASSERLVVTDTPEPAKLPPAPANLTDEADRVPSGPKKVRTLVVRPDGTIISDTPAGSTGNSQTQTPAPVETVRVQPSAPEATPPAVAPDTQTPAIVAPEQAETPVAQPQSPATQPEPAAPDVPAIVAAPEPTAPVPSVLPKKKPAIPTQVARAPASSGPLNLNSPGGQPVNPAPAANQTPAPTSPTTIARGTYIVQVSSQRSESQAQSAYDGLQRRFPSILGSRTPVIQAANVEGRGTFYRVRIPTGSRDEANRLCESLKGAGGDCFVRRY